MKYYGITIGPIVETIGSVTKPAGLWMASYFFSSLARNICTQLINNKEVDIISPFFQENSKDVGKQDGIGRFNDRIILKYKGEDAEAFEKKTLLGEDGIFKRVKEDKAREIAFCLDVKNNTEEYKKVSDYIEKYVYIRCIGVPEDKVVNGNALETLSGKLDCLELMDTVRPSGSERYIAAVLSDNEKVKKYREFSNKIIEESGFSGIQNILLKEKKVRDIESIAAGEGKDSKYKSKEYFAVVYADGDHIGKVISQLGTGEKESVTREAAEEAQKTFSKKCLEYTESSAELINKYGGLTIYAGGDDLLFLAPLRTAKKNIFSLCQEITDKFNEVFSEERDKLGKEGPSLSYGISINYFKFPLYEAVDDARRLLFAEAKWEPEEDPQKEKKRIYNSIALALRKASGQKVEVVLEQGSKEKPGQTMKEFKDLLDEFISKNHSGAEMDTDKASVRAGDQEKSDADRIAHNVIFTLENQKNVISHIWKTDDNLSLENKKSILGNFFDNETQKNMDMSLIVRVADAIREDITNYKIRIKNSHEDTEIIDGITALMRICKFFVEKGVEQS